MELMLNRADGLDDQAIEQDCEDIVLSFTVIGNGQCADPCEIAT